jgi:hypothetical protein
MVGTVQHQLFLEHLQLTQEVVAVQFKFLLGVLQQAQAAQAVAVMGLEAPERI